MKTKNLLIVLLIAAYACSNKTATITEIKKDFYTYPFSGPNFIPQPERNYYPYFRYGEFSKDSILTEWKVVEMENDYVKVHILPEIGGKIWGAIEKTTGNEFIYYNSVVKFRDIAMRGPWTSGGIEFNFGVIGHSPHVSTPVDYKIRNNDDGSVSCFIGGIELFTRTRWETEINLQPDKAYFTTNTKWNNVTPVMQSYYNWSNAAYQAEGDLEFVFPGNTRISHGGTANTWPINQEGRNMSIYNENDFDGDKSNHIMGALNGFYGAYLHDLNFGSGHYARYGDKLGGKLFLWSLSRQGGIWEDLLTDTDGQYVELQAGRLFNQPGSNSTKTPFKHFGFLPHAYDEFKEYWYPVMNIGGMLQSNSFGALNIMENNTEQEIYFSPLQPIKDEIKIYFGDELKYTFNINLKPLEVWKMSINKNQGNEPLKIIVGVDKKLIYIEKYQISSRPNKIPDSFNWNSVYGLYIEGVNWIYQGRFERAYEKLTACLELDSLYAPALNHLAELELRKNDLESAIKNVKKSLSMNTYDPKANFVFGLISKQMNHLIDAQDGFAVASITPEYREAANLELAKLFIQKNELLTAQEYVEKVLTKEANNQDAILLMSIISRRNRKMKEASKYIDQLESISPLNHFTRSERLFIKTNKQTTKNFISLIRNELPYQTFMELALWYDNLGGKQEAIEILELAPEKALINLHLAYLYQNINKVEKSEFFFKKFIQSTSDLVLPYRKEMISPLEWAISKTDNWKPKYYLGLLYWSLGNKKYAQDLFNICGESPDSPYFYLAKSNLFKSSPGYNSEQNLLKARELGIDDWRTSLSLVDYYLYQNLVEKALEVSINSIEKFPDNDALKYTYAKCLLANGLYSESLNELENTTILPFEGARYGRITYRLAAIMESIQLLKDQKFEHAIKTIEKARLWPENLGVGRPYTVDERIEDFLVAENMLRLNNKDKAHELYEEIVDFSKNHPGRYKSTDFIYLISLKRLNKHEEVNDFLKLWREKSPQAPLLKWSDALLNNNRLAARVLEEEIKTKTGGTPWDPQYADTEFELIKEIFKNINL